MFGPIGSSVLTFNGYKQTETQAKYITFQRIESLNIFFYAKIAFLQKEKTRHSEFLKVFKLLPFYMAAIRTNVSC